MRIVKDPEAQYYTPGTGITIVNGVISVDIGTTSTTVSAGNHDHDGVYALEDHDHDEEYAAYDHEHDYSEVYADIGHDHGNYYAYSEHDHDEDYADIHHNHGTVYALKEHLHELADISDLSIGTSSTAITSSSDALVTGSSVYDYIEGRLESVTTGGTRRDIYINDSSTPIYSGDDLRLIAGTGITLQPAQSGQMTTITISGTGTVNNDNSGTSSDSGGNSSNTTASVSNLYDIEDVDAVSASVGDMLVYTEVTENGITSNVWKSRSISVNDLSGLRLIQDFPAYPPGSSSNAWSNVSELFPVCTSYSANSGAASWVYCTLDNNTLELVNESLGDPSIIRVKTASLGQYSVDGTTITASNNNQLSVNLSGLVDGTTLKVSNNKISVDPSAVSGGGGLTVTGTPQDGDVLIYSSSANSGNGGWIPGTVSGSGSNNYVEITIPAGTSTYTSLPLVLNTGDIAAGWLHCIQAGQGAAGAVLAEFYADGAGNTHIYSMDPSTDRIEFWGNLDSNGNLQILPSNTTYAWKIGFHYTVYRAPVSQSNS